MGGIQWAVYNGWYSTGGIKWVVFSEWYSMGGIQWVVFNGWYSMGGIQWVVFNVQCHFILLYFCSPILQHSLEAIQIGLASAKRANFNIE